MNNPLRSRGMADVAFEAYALASKNAGIDIDARADKYVVQAKGGAAASKGYHFADGTLDDTEYTAAFDASVKGLTRTQIATWLECLCEAGCVAFFRNWTGNVHIHGNYAGLPQKRQLDGQNEDFFDGKDGLVGHRRIDDEWWFPELEARRIPEAMFRKSNPKNGKGVVVRSPLVVKAQSVVVVPQPELPTTAFYLNDEPKPRFWMPVSADVSYAPVRSFGSALGFDTEYHPDRNQITYDGEEVPIALRKFAGVGHAPVRQLVREVGLVVRAVEGQKVFVGRP